MKRALLVLLIATSAFAQQVDVVTRVGDDAMVIDRVTQASKRDLPTDLLRRIVNEDIDLLRGKRPDGTYEYATYERLEASRTNTSFSIQPRTDKMQTVEAKGAFVYRVVIDVPSRRLVVRKNRPVWVERVDFEYVADGRTNAERSSVDIKAWMQPGEVKPLDLPAVAKQAKVSVIAATEPKGGYGNLDVSLVHAKIVDNADSPHAEAVASAKAILRGLDNGDVGSIRASAQRMRERLGGRRTATTPAPVIATAPSSTLTVTAAPDRASELELQTELQVIEDLLTGTESERREGLDKLHQLIRRMRR